MGTHQGSARPLQQQQQQQLLLLLISLLLRAGYPEPGRQMELLKSCLENFLTVAFCALSPISPDLASSYCFACLCVYVCVWGGPGGVFPFFSFTDCALRNAFNPSTVSHEILRTWVWQVGWKCFVNPFNWDTGMLSGPSGAKAASYRSTASRRKQDNTETAENRTNPYQPTSPSWQTHTHIHRYFETGPFCANHSSTWLNANKMGRFVLVIRVAFDTLFLARSVLRAPTHHCSTVEMVMRTQHGRTTRLLLTHSCRAPCATKGGGGGSSRTREMASSWAETLLEKKKIKRIASSVDGLFILKIRCVYLFTFCEMRPGCVLKRGGMRVLLTATDRCVAGELAICSLPRCKPIEEDQRSLAAAHGWWGWNRALKMNVPEIGAIGDAVSVCIRAGIC